MVPSGLACRDFVELVTEYLEASLPQGARAECDLHLAACDACTTYLEQMRQTIWLLGQAAEDALPPAGREALVDQFRRLTQA